MSFSARAFLESQRSSSLSPLQRQAAKRGILFLLPFLIGFVAFTVAPLLLSLVYSFMNFNILKPELNGFAGLGNYARFLGDGIAHRSLLLTMGYVAVWTPISVLAPLGIALLLHNKHLKGSKLFRLLFYIPSLLPEAVLGLMIYGFFSERGWFYRLFLQPFGASYAQTGMFMSQFMGLMLFNISLWAVGNSILILFAARKGVPVEQYEAARIDGACPICTLVKITLPAISPIIFYSFVISLIGAFQFFAASFSMTSGGYDLSQTLFYTVYMYHQMFILKDMGYASALGWVYLLLTALFTGAIFVTSRKWVFYDSDY
jgi:multiple sugar transport system permease protein